MRSEAESRNAERKPYKPLIRRLVISKTMFDILPDRTWKPTPPARNNLGAQARYSKLTFLLALRNQLGHINFHFDRNYVTADHSIDPIGPML